jgi:Flp pilus assembly protein TadD
MRFTTVFVSALLSTCMLVAVTPTVSASNRETTLSGTYLAGRSAGRLRDMEEAADYLTSALALDPGNPQIIERLFQFRLAEGSIAEAETLATQVIAFNSQQRLARVVLGLKELRAGQFRDARTHFSEASYTPVGELTSVLLNAWAFAGEGALKPALQELEKLATNETFTGLKSFHEGLITDLLNSKLRAEQAFKKANEQSGSSLRVAQGYASFLSRNGKSDAAKQVLEAYLKNSENNDLIKDMLKQAKTGAALAPLVANAEQGAGEALFAIAAAMNDEESADVALLYARLALASKADAALTNTLLGDIYSGMQRYELSNVAYGAVGASSALRTNADIQMALNFQRMDNAAEAQSRLKSLVAKEPLNIEAWSTLGNVYRNGNDYVSAAMAYTKAIEVSAVSGAPDWQLYYNRGICNERNKDWGKAELDFISALKIVPDEPSLLNYYGYSLIDRREKLTKAMDMVKRAVDLRPNDGFIVDSLGWAHYQLGNFEEALVQIERAADLKPGDPIIAEHLGDVYWQVDRKLEARFQWQHAKDNEPEPEDLKRIDLKLKEGLITPPPVKPVENEVPKPNNG